MNACTIIARNYLAQARVLAQSFREHHPNGSFATLVIDADEDFIRAGSEEFEVLGLADIGIDRREVHRMAMLYDVMELATAVKPWLLRTMLDRSSGPVAYFDPDIEIFEPLDDIFELAEKHSIVLTPHTLSPLAHDRREPGEVTLLLAGMFNLGFIAVAETAVPFLDWWAERLARSGHMDPPQAQFVDQRWVDYVPSLFEHAVLRDPACNVAHWNLESRRFERVDGGYRVDGRPLRFFHFSGFDPDRPHLLSKFLGREPRILLSRHPALAEICLEYRRKLLAAGYREAKSNSYAFDSADSGLRITSSMRSAYRRALNRAEAKDEQEPPNPFADGAEAFIAWLNEPDHPAAPELTRYLAALHEQRGDLQARFPNPRWDDRSAYLDWVLTVGRRDEQIPSELLPGPLEERPPASDPVVGGVNVAGYFRAEAGVGQAARHVLVGLERAGIPYSTFAYDKTLSRQAHAFVEAGENTYDVNVICVNADQVLSFGHDVGPEFFRGRHSIGVWWWEVARFPERFQDAFGLVSEVWVGSEFARRAIAAETDKPVLTFPLGLELPVGEPSVGRSELGVPEGFVFLFSFDFDSRFERKNPLAVVDAFRQAFEPGEGPTLFLKTINGDRNLQDLENLRFAIADRDDIVLRNGYLSADETAALTAVCDCYVSLHRSEGFGLTIAEAMAHGKPVIATAYSGNLEYMTAETSRLVPYHLIPIPPGVDPYPAGTEWADPDIGVAAEFMRELYDHPERAAVLGLRARDHVSHVLSPDRTAEFLTSRLNEIWELRAGGSEEEAPPSAADRAYRYLTEGPANPIRGPSRFGFAGRFLRRLVYRAIRPYTVRHSEFEHAVVDALRELGRQIDETAETIRGEGQHERARLRASIDHAVASQADEIRGVADSIKDFKRSTAELVALSGEVRRLEGELHAEPYVAEQGLFTLRGARGERLMGYVGGQSSDAGTYRAFEEIFRGPETFIRERQRFYVDVLAGHEPVLDVGCGRGELLELLREAGIEAGGVDLDEDMVAHCRAKGLTVEFAEATDYLARLEDGSLGAVFAARVIEHMPYDVLLRFFDLSRRKLAAGGLFVVETVNPHSIRALKSFWVDLTHEQPVFPEVALALCRLHGFESARVVFPNGRGELERDRVEQVEYAVFATTTAATPRTSTSRESAEPYRVQR